MSNLILSNVLNYQEELISLFARFLTRTGASSKTARNYISDIRHFFSWFMSVSQERFSTITQASELLLAVDRLSVLMYKRALWETQTPVATINRRLSSLRSFFTFALDEKLISDNITNALENIDKNTDIAIQNSKLIADYFATQLPLLPDPIRLKQSAFIDEFLNWIRKRK